MKSKKKFLSIFAVFFASLFAVGLVFGVACKKDKEEEEETTPQHTHNYVVTDSKDATCGEDGYITYTCEDGDDTYTETVKATGNHTWDEGTVTQTYPCVEGEKLFKCTVCGATYTEAVDAVDEHTFTITDEGENITWKWATDYSSATATVTCDVCGNDIENKAEVSSTTNETGTTYTATVTINGTAYTDEKFIAVEEPEPEPEAPDPEELPISVDFSNPETYTWISYRSPADSEGTITLDNASTYTNGILTLVTLKSDATNYMTINGETMGALNTTGRTESSSGIWKYISINLEDYFGETVTISATMDANGSGRTRSLYLTTTLEGISSQAGSPTAEYLAIASSTDKGTPVPLEKTITVTNEYKTLYFIFNDNINIYTIDIEVVDEEPKTQSGVKDADELKAALKAETDEITLTADITGTFEISYEVTIDLAGYTITNAATDTTHTVTVKEDGKLTVTDSGHAGDVETVYGTIDSVVNNCAAIYVAAGGEAVLNGGTFTRSLETGTRTWDDGATDWTYTEGGNSWYTIYNAGTLTIATGATVKNTGAYSSMIDNFGTLTITGGCLDGGLNTIKNEPEGIITVSGGYLSNSVQAVVMNYGTLTIEDGEFFQSGEYGYVILNPYNPAENAPKSTTINGGTFDGTNADTVIMVDADEMTMTGGTFTGGLSTVLIYEEATVAISGGTFEGSYYDVIENFGTLAISGGTFTAGADYVNVIWNEATVKISGGTFTGAANAAAIYTYGGTIEISDGTYAAANYSTDEGGITTYYYYNVLYAEGYGSITVSGGVIEGWMGTYDNGTITITGGYFTLDPSNYDGVSYVAEGYVATETEFTVGGDTYTMYVVASKNCDDDDDGSTDGEIIVSVDFTDETKFSHSDSKACATEDKNEIITLTDSDGNETGLCITPVKASTNSDGSNNAKIESQTINGTTLWGLRLRGKVQTNSSGDVLYALAIELEPGTYTVTFSYFTNSSATSTTPGTARAGTVWGTNKTAIEGDADYVLKDSGEYSATGTATFTVTVTETGYIYIGGTDALFITSVEIVKTAGVAEA